MLVFNSKKQNTIFIVSEFKIAVK